MSSSDFQDATLVLLAHGSTVNTASASPALLHGEALRARGLFADVTEAFYKQEPRIETVLHRISSPRVFFVPLCIANGWFTEQVLPLALGMRAPDAEDFARVQRRGTQILHYCQPIGSHPAMTGVLEARARDVVARYPAPQARAPLPAETALFIAGHGTAYSRGSREAIESQVRRLREKGEYAEVHGLFLEESPFVGEAWQLAAAPNLVVLPFFISDGLHVAEDIPTMLGQPAETVRERLASGLPTWPNPTSRNGQRLWVAGAVGAEPLVTEIVLERVWESASLTPSHPDVGS